MVMASTKGFSEDKILDDLESRSDVVKESCKKNLLMTLI